MSFSKKVSRERVRGPRVTVGGPAGVPPALPSGSPVTPLTRASVAIGGVAAPQEVESMVVVEARGAWAAGKLAAAVGVVLIP